MTYRDQFPDFPTSDLPGILPGFADSSWRNDVCPSFTSEALGLVLWVDFADPMRREFPEWDRYRVTSEENSIVDLMSSNDFAAVVVFVSEHIATLPAARLNDWYESSVGYRPQVDCPDMPDADLRHLCRCFLRAATEAMESRR
ncbi:hypothetical protein [Rhodopseudomonas palustris]|uniref:hypothetical protein n=1 Tax=Rhodopseudomonas palustris TaxID=1076 RepID=UPI000642334F|nr:hypothetical protein [Rhodopseudomonas palustris]